MSDVMGFGQIGAALINGTVQLVNDLLPHSSNQVTVANGSSDSDSHYYNETHTAATQAIDRWVDTITKSVNSADPEVIAAMKGLADQAISNSNDTSKTTGLVAGILQNAGDAMRGVFGKQNTAGIYDSSSAATMNNDLMARASADAASAILGYQTQQQSIAAGVLDNLAKATATTETQTQTHDQAFERATTDVRTDGLAGSRTKTQQTQQTTSKSGRSIICTWLHENNYIPTRRYAKSTALFLLMPFSYQKGYLAVSTPLLAYLRSHETTTFLSRLIIWLFVARTEYVCAASGLREARKTFGGWLARAIIATVVFFPSLYFLTKEKLFGQELVLEY